VASGRDILALIVEEQTMTNTSVLPVLAPITIPIRLGFPCH